MVQDRPIDDHLDSHFSDNLRDPVTKRIRELEKINEVVKAFGKEPLDKERSSVDGRQVNRIRPWRPDPCLKN